MKIRLKRKKVSQAIVAVLKMNQRKRLKKKKGNREKNRKEKEKKVVNKNTKDYLNLKESTK